MSKQQAELKRRDRERQRERKTEREEEGVGINLHRQNVSSLRKDATDGSNSPVAKHSSPRPKRRSRTSMPRKKVERSRGEKVSFFDQFQE